MKIFFPATLFLLFCNTGKAQSKSIYFEAGGPGVASVNYDMRFQKTEGGFGGRIGVGGFSLSDGGSKTGILLLPIGVNYLLGKDERNYFEIGGGITPVFVTNKDWNGSGNFSGTVGHLNIGYRLQPKNSGILFRAGLVPIFGKNGFIPYYAGLSFGYKF
ncbi:MAG: hypothetical protein IPP72_07925 [Chitinophagaceae bacterium]|nr:hypothetical protein [Chitinophagaceae bacterium]